MTAEAYVEPGATWRAFWLVAAFLAALMVLGAVLPGPDLSAAAWFTFIGASLGGIGGSTFLARRAWTLRVDETALSVGRERVPLSDIDVGHLASVDSGVDADAPVLGGGWSLPKGRTGLPLRLTDGRTVLVPTQEPAALRAAVLGRRGTLGS
jgi:hypothetical protein